MNEQAHSRPVDREPAAAMRGVWSALDAAATPLSTLAILAALVRTLSPSDYGILVVAIAASGLSMAVNPAIAAATTKFVSELSGRTSPGGRTVSGVITVSLMTVATIDLALLLVTAAFNESLSEWVFGAAVERVRQIGPVLVLAVIGIGIQQLETVLAAAIRGLERFRRQALIELLSRAALTSVVTYVAWYTRSLEKILIAQCMVYLLSTLVRAVALRGLLPHKRLFEMPSWPETATQFRYGGWMWLTALAGVAYTSADRVMVGLSLGAVAAGRYNIYVQITQLIHFIPSSVFAFSLPAFSRLAAHGSSHKDEIAKAYKTYLVTISIVALGIAAAMLVSWPFLVSAIAGPALAGDRFGAPGLLTLNFLLLACNVAPYYLLIALGRAKDVSMICTISMLAALVLMAILIPRYGLEGAALARLAYGVGALMLLQRAQCLLKPT